MKLNTLIKEVGACKHCGSKMVITDDSEMLICYECMNTVTTGTSSAYCDDVMSLFWQELQCSDIQPYSPGDGHVVRKYIYDEEEAYAI